MLLGNLKYGQHFVFNNSDGKGRSAYYIYCGWKNSFRTHVCYTDPSGLNKYFSNRFHASVRVVR